MYWSARAITSAGLGLIVLRVSVEKCRLRRLFANVRTKVVYFLNYISSEFQMSDTIPRISYSHIFDRKNSKVNGLDMQQILDF